MRPLLPTTFIAFIALQAIAVAKEVRHSHMASGNSESAAVSFLIEKEDFQSLLKQLPNAAIEIDRAAITKRIVQQLNRFEMVLSEGQTIESLSEQLFDEVVLPVLGPRVEKFNELLNAGVTKDRVSAGFLAFTGLAKSMASRSRSAVSTVAVAGVYNHTPPDFENGEWKWWNSRAEEWQRWGIARACTVSGTTNINAHLSGAIEEEIELDLAPYGIDQKFTVSFDCDGEVSLEQVYECRYVWSRKKPSQTGPVASVSVRPQTTVTATKELNLGSYFRLVDTGESWFSKTAEETFEYPAMLEFEVTAEKD